LRSIVVACTLTTLATADWPDNPGGNEHYTLE
jgi:hypothetical protein